MLDSEFAALIEDTTKTIQQDITWLNDSDHSPAVEFRAEVENALDYHFL
jgi:hypothetical protein